MCHSWFAKSLIILIFWIWRSKKRAQFRGIASPAYHYYMNFSKSISFLHLKQSAKWRELRAGLSQTKRHHFVKYFLLLFLFLSLHFMSALKRLYFLLFFFLQVFEPVLLNYQFLRPSPHLGAEVKDQRAGSYLFILKIVLSLFTASGFKL